MTNLKKSYVWPDWRSVYSGHKVNLMLPVSSTKCPSHIATSSLFTVIYLTSSSEKTPRSLTLTPIRSIHLINLKNSLLRQISSANAVQKVALEQLLVQARCKIKSMRSAERSRKNRWNFKRGQLAFKAGKSLLDPKCKATLRVNKETLDHHKSSTVSDQFYDIPLDDLEGLPPTPSITKPFSITTFKYEEFDRIVSTRRNASAPGLNGIPYKVYKKCTKICAYLFNIFKCCFKNRVVPIQWCCAKEVYIPKNKTPNNSHIKDFRPIALLNVEGKLFFSLVSKRLETHIIINNKFINLSIQKG